MHSKNFTKKIMSLFLVAAMVLPYFSWIQIVKAEMDWTNFKPTSSITETDLTGYIPISSKTDLDKIRNNLSGKYYLTTDIVFTVSDFLSGGVLYHGGSGWEPIGPDDSHAFTGIFDGNGHTITGLNLGMFTNGNIQYQGVFGVNYGTIKNLGVVSINNNSTLTGFKYLGGIAANNYGTIDNSYHDGVLLTNPASYAAIGGIAGVNIGTITNSYNAASVTAKGPSDTGGIAGVNAGTIDGCYNNGPISNIGNHTAGIAAQSSGSIYNSYNKGTISSSGWAAGIFATDTASAISWSFPSREGGSINNCYNMGTIIGVQAGGIGASVFNHSITNCFNSGSISGNQAGGIITQMGSSNGKSATLKYCYNIGAVSSSQGELGGIAAGSINADSITNCYFLNSVQKAVGQGPVSSTVYSKSLAQMQTQSTFSNFDFTNTWVMPSGIKSTPLLRSLYVPLSAIVLKDTTLIKNQKINILQPVPSNATFTDCIWTSSNPSVASVDANGTITALSIGKTFIYATSKQGGYSAYSAVTVVEGVESVSLPKSENVLVGNSITLNPVITPTIAFNKRLVWSSSNPQVATVDSNGNVQGFLPGTAVITAATTDGSKLTAQSTVNVIRPVTGISLKHSESSIMVGSMTKLSVDIAPADASNKAVTWTSSDASVATVDSDGYVLGTGRGSVTITATTADGGFTDSITLDVIQTVTEINLNQDTIGMDPGTQIQLNADVFPINANDKSIVWTSTDENVATVSDNGTINAISDGVAIIVAKSQDGQSTSHCAVIVGNTPFNEFIQTKVSGLSTKSNNYDSITVSWPTMAIATGYEIYNSESLDGDYKEESQDGRAEISATSTKLDNSKFSYQTLSGADPVSSQSFTISKVVTGKPLYFKVRGYYIYNGYKIYSQFSNPILGEAQIGTVSGVNAASVSFNSIKVGWAAVNGASGYEVARATSSTGTYSIVGTTTAASLTNTGVATNTGYYYKVRAYRMVGTEKVYGNFSKPVIGKAIPSIPVAVKAASASYNSIKTSWAAVSGASGYEVYRAASSTGTYSYAGSTTATSFTNAGLAINYTYYFKVRAYRLVGTTKVYSSFSVAASAKPLPSVSGSVKAASASYNSIKTSWAAVSGASGYEVYRAASVSGTYSLTGRTTATSFTNTGLATNVPYYYKVRAYRLVGTTKVYGSFSSVVSAKPVPSAPASFKAVRYSSSAIKLTWGAVSGASGYEIYRSTYATGTYSLIKATTSLSYINTSLTRNRVYYYKIRAYRMVGKVKVYSSWSTVVSAKPY